MRDSSLTGVWGTLDAKERKALLAVGRERTFGAGDIVIREGDRKRSILIILSGEVVVLRRDRSGREVMIASLKRGSCLGELSLFLGEPRSADVVAKSEARMLEISHRAYTAHRRHFGGLAHQLTVLIARRLRETTQKLVELAFLDVPSRVLSALRSLATSRQGPSGPEFYCELPKQHELAAMVGSSREMVNRALTLLEETREIARRGPYVLIRNQQ